MIHDDIHHLMPIDDNYYIKTGIEHKLHETAEAAWPVAQICSQLHVVELTQISDDIGQEVAKKRWREKATWRYVMRSPHDAHT